MTVPAATVDTFLVAATVPLDAWHATGTTDRARAILGEHPDVAGAGIYCAAVLGDTAGVRRWLTRDPGLARAAGGPHGWDALTHLCFSRFLRDAPDDGDFVGAAAALLDAGADVRGGFFEPGHQPNPVWESLLYGAAGIAHHPGLTRLLLDRGADPNDEETPYHTPETTDNAALQVLLDSGALKADSLATLLLRKHDWHDLDGVRRCLAAGADPNRMTRWGRTALFQAVTRDNGAEAVAACLEHGGNPALGTAGTSAMAEAARRGRGDLLGLFERAGHPVTLTGLDALLAACARDDGDGIAAVIATDPSLGLRLAAGGGRRLVEFAGVGNAPGVARLLDLGVPVDAPLVEGDGYFGLAPGSTALHSASWRGRHEVVDLLVARHAALDRRDGHGRTALALAVKACVDSHWTARRAPDSVRRLLAAGADPQTAPFPSGYDAVDRLLEAART